MAHYYMDENGNITKKKKKKSADYHMDENGNVTKISNASDDIAPVKGGNKDSVFKSGGFSDGVDGIGDFFGDLGQTIVGTTLDLGLGIAKGVGRLAEGVVDLGTYAVAGAADLFGADEFADKTKKVAQYSATDEWTKGAVNYFDQYSVLGNKADMVSEGIGQVGAIILTGGAAGAAGLGTVGATALTTGLTGLSGMGSGMNEAYAMGASDGNAFAYGLAQGSVEAVSELIFGGLGKGFKAVGVSKGLTSIDDVFAKKISNTAAKFITSEAGQKIVGNTLEWAVKSGAEGVEEVVSGFGSAIAKDAFLLNGKDEKAFGEILKDENLLEQFVVGSITSAIAQSGYMPGMTRGSLRQANKTGRDFVSGLSKNEQTVIDKVYEQRLAEESENRTLSKQDKNKLYDRVVDEVKRGYVSTDEIESILGGKTYEGYKSLTEKKKSLEARKKAIEKEIKELVKTPKYELTVEQDEKITALREEAKGIKEELQNLGIRTAKNNLFNEVNKLTAKDTYLRESYNDLVRQTQALKVDDTQYKGTKFEDAAKKTIENARNSGANNSIKVRDFVEFSAKYSSVSGTVIDFKSDADIKGVLVSQLKADIAKIQNSTAEADKVKLSELQETLKKVQEGKIRVNGVKTKNGVAINLESPNYLNTVLGHEVTHFLEKKKFYEPLQKAIFKYAQSKGDYDDRRKALEALYKNIDGTTVDYELTADLVGDYLFTEYDFIKNLSTENRNVFQQIYDQIKYMFKLATAGSKEARELEKVMHQFEKVLRESVESGQNSDEKTRFSMSGEKSKTADTSLLQKANDMAVDGIDSETIRQETGWYKGYDDQWRYEIDDSEFEYYPDADAKGYSKDPDVIRARELFKRSQNGEVTESEFEELRSLMNEVGFEKMFPTYLSDYVSHDKLFEAYPQLKNMAVSVKPLSENTSAAYNLHTKTISINENIINDDVAVKNALIHEIQHAIQDIEGFAQGASVEYWKEQRQDIVDTIGGARANLDLWLEDIGYPEFAKSSMQEVANREKTLEQHWEDCKEFKANSKYAKQIALCEAELAEFQRQYDEITNGMTAYEQYRNTAGEIEARDAENRLNLTAEERKNTRPDIDRSDVVFAENGTASYAIKHDKNGNKYWEIDSGKDIFKGLNTPEEYRDAAFEYLIANRDNKVTVKDNSGNDIVFIRLSAEEFTHSAESEELFENNPEMFNQKMRLAPSLEDILMNANVNWHSPDHKNHKLFKEKGFENYRGKVRIDNVIFNSIVRVGKANFGDVFYDINLEVDSYLPHTKSDASDINESTSIEDIIAPLPENVNTQFSLSTDQKKTDADYKFAVENGDTETAQKMVDEAAKNAGYGIKAYHGTGYDFTVFDKSKQGDNYQDWGRLGKGFYFAPTSREAETWAELSKGGKNKVMPVYLRSENMLDSFEALPDDLKDTIPENWEGLTRRLAEKYAYNYIEYMQEFGYNVQQILTEKGYDGINGHTEFVVFDPEQVKSADTVTYDDDGNVIPLSERFNTANEDIRYSLSGEGEKRTLGGSYRFDGKDFLVKSAQDIAPVIGTTPTTENTVAEGATFDAPMLENIPVLPDEELDNGAFEAIRPKPEKQPSMKRVNNSESKEHIAQVLTEEPKVEKKKKSIISTAIRNFVDKGAVFENLSLKTKNRALQDTYKAMGRSETKAQYFMENGTEGVKPLNDIIAEVEQTGKTKEFYEYLYHKHNVDRMSLESRERPKLERLTSKMNDLKLLSLKENQLRAIASEKITNETAPQRADLIKTVREYLKSKDVKNKPVFDYSVTAEMSQETAKQYEAINPEFKEYAQDVYNYMNHLRKMMVDKGVISQETADLWAKTYPYYVPLRRVGHEGSAVNVPLDTNKTGINAPIKGATGGNSDILPLFETMAQRTLQTFKAVDKNRFGIELKNTLGGVTESTTTSLDEAIDSIDAHESLLQEGKNGKNPTFTVFEGGERVTFEITDEMYDALKPTSEGLSYTNKVLNTASNLHRGVLTEYSVPFMVTNAIKDAQDVLINSQHPAQTYANSPVAIKELITKGKWYTEYMENGGGDNTYFDKQTNTFNKEKSALRKVVGFPLDKISDANNFIEKVPRLAEYIASRKKGASIDAAMLDAARVTTDFSAGGDVTKFLNRNGATFLNASVQGFAQQVRNVREAKMKGLKGWLGLATKITLAGLPAMLLNGLLWDDDEEYEELSDYVKENYYIVGKYGDGKFVRIPKGRTLAVIQNGFEQISNTLTGDDEADFGRFFELFLSNLAPNNPLDNNIIAPIKQVMENKTWYGEDLVPTRLQDLPAAEQYDESTDAISKWLGEKINVSPYKINYLLNQYSGGVGDIVLPMMTPEAESGDNSLLGNIIAPLKDKFTTDSVMNNQNVSDFYSKADELKVKANSSYATEEDILKSKYMNAVNSELGELYKAKREIQNSSLSDEEKYALVREIQKQINTLAKESLNTYSNVVSDDNYANVGDKHYKLNDDGEWQKINDKQVEKQAPFVKVYGGYSSYLTYSSDLYDIKADKDENGKTINGSRKEKVLNYINNLDADYETKIILWKSEYPSDDTYNMEIINYINGRTDLTYEERVSIFTELGFSVSNGTVYWD